MQASIFLALCWLLADLYCGLAAKWYSLILPILNELREIRRDFFSIDDKAINLKL